MARRPPGTKMGRPSSAETLGTFLDAKPKPQLPSGLGQEVLAAATGILATAPHIAQAQIPLVVRLAQTRLRRDRLHRQVEREPLVVPDRFGAAKPNPAVAMLEAAERTLSVLERNLALTVPAAAQSVPKSAQAVAQSASTQIVTRSGRVLRLA